MNDIRNIVLLLSYKQKVANNNNTYNTHYCKSVLGDYILYKRPKHYQVLTNRELIFGRWFGQNDTYNNHIYSLVLDKYVSRLPRNY